MISADSYIQDQGSLSKSASNHSFLFINFFHQNSADFFENCFSKNWFLKNKQRTEKNEIAKNL